MLRYVLGLIILFMVIVYPAYASTDCDCMSDQEMNEYLLQEKIKHNKKWIINRKYVTNELNEEYYIRPYEVVGLVKGENRNHYKLTHSYDGWSTYYDEMELFEFNLKAGKEYVIYSSKKNMLKIEKVIEIDYSINKNQRIAMNASWNRNKNKIIKQNNINCAEVNSWDY